MKSDTLVYIGTYTEKKPDGSKGIYVAPFDASTGQLAPLTVAAEMQNPSFVAASRDARFLYAVSEVGVAESGGPPTGFVDAYSVGAAGRLTHLDRVASGGADPCHIMVSANGRTVAVANYTGGSVATFHTGPDGRLGARMVDRHAGHGRDPKRQEGPHSHSVNFTPNDAFLLSCDLGLDRVFVYRHDPRTAAVAPHSAPFVALEPGSGPRHLALHPSGRYAYVIAELTSSIAAFAWNGTTGALRQMQSISTLPFGYTGSNTTAEIAVHPSGRFVYGSNRGHDSIAAFSVDAKTGRLTFLSHTPSGGKAPRSFAIDPTGRWLIAANQLSDNLVSFAIDQHTGALKPTGAAVTVPRAVCVAFVPTAG